MITTIIEAITTTIQMISTTILMITTIIEVIWTIIQMITTIIEVIATIILMITTTVQVSKTIVFCAYTYKYPSFCLTLAKTGVAMVAALVAPCFKIASNSLVFAIKWL